MMFFLCINYPDISEDEEAFKSTATVAALATANRAGAPTPPARGRGGPGARERGRGAGGPHRGRGNPNRGRGGGQPQPRQYHNQAHSNHRGRITVLENTAPRNPPPTSYSGPSSVPSAGPSSLVQNPPERTGPIQISSESDSDGEDEAPYYGGYGRCYRCSKDFIHDWSNGHLIYFFSSDRRGHWANACPF